VFGSRQARPGHSKHGLGGLILFDVALRQGARHVACRLEVEDSCAIAIFVVIGAR
jgi:hypothetical protein